MALPRKGDPRRPLYLAIHSISLLALILLLPGGCAIVMLLTGGVDPWANSFLVEFSIILFSLVPGTICVIVAINLIRRKLWAVVTGIVLASTQCLVVVMGVIGLIFKARLPAMGVMVACGIALLILLAFGQLIHHLTLSYRAIQTGPLDGARGFDVIPLAKIAIEQSPIEPDEQQHP